MLLTHQMSKHRDFKHRNAWYLFIIPRKSPFRTAKYKSATFRVF